MDEYAQSALEFDKLLDLLASYACSRSGVEFIRSLHPKQRHSTRPWILDSIDEAIRLRQGEQEMPGAHFDSPREALGLVAPVGAVLPIEELFGIRNLLSTTRDVTRFLAGGICAPYPALIELGGRMPDLETLLIQMARVFDDDGEILDSASPKLGEIRRKLSALERRIRSRLDNILHNDELEGVIQDQHIAMRNGRYVIPIRRDLRTRMKGVVHDQSNTGQTLFMEPATTLEDGNELAGLKFEERDEIRKILAKLSNQVRIHSDAIHRTFKRMTIYDYVYAISSWGRSYDCRYAKFGEELRLKTARHPLLQAQFRQEGREEELIPLDMCLPEGHDVLVITGSNTGGKTVILKTVGLLTVASLVGLPVPCAEGSVLRRFRAVFADIGDEQSLEQNLSTFSSHLSRIREIVIQSKRGNALLLLDELGSGTDPAEGSAISCSVLESLVGKDCLALGTTHLAAVKQFVHDQDRMTNACVLFNDETLSPEYRLQIGRPGASHAMTIARRIGIPDEILKRAEDFLDKEQLRLENILAQMDADQQQLQKDKRIAEHSRKQIEREQQELEEELSTLRRERKKLLNKAQREAAAIVDNSRKEMEQLIRRAGKGLDKDDIKHVRDVAEKKKYNVRKSIAATESKPVIPLTPQDLTIGMRVWVEVLNDHGIIVSLSNNNKRGRVEVNGMSFDVKANQLGRELEAAPAEKRSQLTTAAKPKNATPARTELKLLGVRVEPGIQELERFIDSAALAGLFQLRIVHGFGTGAMREAVHDYLKTCPVVKKYRVGRPDKDEGGAGVTWVEL